MTYFLLIAVAVGLVVCLFWPRVGVLARWRRARELGARARREDTLKHILKSQVSGSTPTIESIAGSLQIMRNQTVEVLEELENRKLISFEEGRIRLTPSGRDLALHVVRAHRLWESYLAEQTGIAESEWHNRAERQEHLLTPEQADDLAARLGNPPFDPHGDAIPSPEGEIPAERGEPVTAVSENQPVHITHIEDEPQTVYAQITAQGIRPGMKAFVIEKLPHRIRLWAEGNEHVIAPVVANNIFVEPLLQHDAKDLLEEEYLAGLVPGQKAQILGLSPACRGQERRRLLDLGFVPGTAVEAEMTSPGGDPTAYIVRGTVVALRREQAGLIRISTRPPVAA